MVKVNWSPDNEKKLLLHLINPSTSNIDTVALAKLFPGATPKAIVERIHKLRRERAALDTTAPLSDVGAEDADTGGGDVKTPKKKRGAAAKGGDGPTTGEEVETPKKKRGRPAKASVEKVKVGNGKKRKNDEDGDEEEKVEKKIKLEVNDVGGDADGEVVNEGGEGEGDANKEEGNAKNQEDKKAIAEMFEEALGKLAQEKGEQEGEVEGKEI